MKIGIDANHLTVPYSTGSKNYSSNLIKSLAKIDKKNQYIIFASKKVNIPKQKNFKLKITPRLLPFSKRQFFLAYFVKKEKVDVFHYLVPYGDPFLKHPNLVVTVHDVNLDETYPLFSKFFFKRLICEITRRPVFSNAKIFVTPTNVIKKELNSFLYNNQKKKILAIYEGVAREFRPLRKFNKSKGFILCMGDFAERKNIKKTLTAYSLLPNKIKKDVSIVIVVSTKGPASKFRDFAKKLGILKNTKIVIHPSNSKLIKLFNQARCFVYPSLYEGFGLPLVEAMSCGCPVITSNYGAMKEVSGRAGILINPSSAQNISKAMKKIILSKRTFNTLKKKSLIRSKKFDWDTTARETLAAYYECLSMKKS